MNSKPIRVLVVEDEPLVLKTLVEGLEEEPLIEVCGQAGTVAEAYDQVLATRPDAIFLDIKLEGGTGFDLLRLLKAENHPVPPVVLNTGHEKFEYVKTAINDFKNEIVHLLQKPFFKDWQAKRGQCLEAIMARRKNQDNDNILKEMGILSVRHKNQSFFLEFTEIQYLEVGGNGTVYVVTNDNQSIHLSRSMTNLLQELPPYLIQISRFNAVNLKAMLCVLHEERKLRLRYSDKLLDIGEKYYHDLLEITR